MIRLINIELNLWKKSAFLSWEVQWSKQAQGSLMSTGVSFSTDHFRPIGNLMRANNDTQK